MTTLIYSYGANAPLENAALVERQFRLAHKYKNDLVALERERRRRVDEAVRELAPEVVPIETEIGRLLEQLRGLRREIRQGNSSKNLVAVTTGGKRGVRGPDEIQEQAAAALKTELKKLWQNRKAIRSRVFKSKAWGRYEAQITGTKKPLLKDGAPVVAMRTLRDGRRVPQLVPQVVPQVDADGKPVLKTNGDPVMNRVLDQAGKPVMVPKERTKRVNGWAEREQKRLRAASGLAGDTGAWGTYGQVEATMKKAHKGAPPNFLPWREYRGKIAVQIQSSKERLPVEKLRGTDNRLRLVVGPVTRPGRSRDRKLGDAELWIRVGSAPDKSPIWTKIPFFFHRPLPVGAEVKWAWLIRDRIGLEDRWKVQITVELAPGMGTTKTDRAQEGVVGIDIGWRTLDDGRLRVAVWVGSDDEQGEIALPAAWTAYRARVEEIASIRSKGQDETRDALTAWLSGRQVPGWLRAMTARPKYPERYEDRGQVLPAEEVSSAEAVARIGQWRSPERFWDLCVRWWANRIPGDEAILALLSTWRNRDRDLCNQECGRREKLQAWRKDIYRKAAAMLRRRYKLARIESRPSETEKKMDLRKFHELPEAEDDTRTPADEAIVARARDAALSILRGALEQSMAACEYHEPSGTTYLCAACGSAQEWDRAQLWHTCSDCGDRYDQDVNAAKNLLEGVSEPGGRRPVRAGR